VSVSVKSATKFQTDFLGIFDMETVTVKKVLRNEKGQFVKGTLGLGGRKPLGQTRFDKLVEAVYRVENQKHKRLLDHFIQQAFVDNSVLIALMRKLHPDLSATALASIEPEMSTEMAEAIRTKLRERYNP